MEFKLSYAMVSSSSLTSFFIMCLQCICMRLHLCWCIKFYSYNSERVRQRHRGALTHSLTHLLCFSGRRTWLENSPVAATTRKAANITAATQTTITTLRWEGAENRQCGAVDVDIDDAFQWREAELNSRTKLKYIA